MTEKIKSALKFYKYICKQNPQYSGLYTSALIKDILKIHKS